MGLLDSIYLMAAIQERALMTSSEKTFNGLVFSHLHLISHKNSLLEQSVTESAVSYFLYVIKMRSGQEVKHSSSAFRNINARSLKADDDDRPRRSTTAPDNDHLSLGRLFIKAQVFFKFHISLPRLN